MSDILLQALVFLINTAFDVYLYILVIRVLLVWVHADYTLPITQFIITTTTFIIKPMRKFIPDYRRIECATLALIFIVAMVKYLLIIALTFGFSHATSALGIVILAIADPIRCLITILSVAILFQALLSWIQPHTRINNVLVSLTAPVMQPLQRVIPPVGGLDITPIIALVLLQLIMIVFVTPILGQGWSIALS